jgi:hypothetical protein
MTSKYRVSNGAVYDRRKQNRTVENVENTRASIGEQKHKQNRSCYRTCAYTQKRKRHTNTVCGTEGDRR